MSKTIILLTGEARAGKDTSADLIQKILKDYDITTDRSYFAKALKESAKAVFNLTDRHVFGDLKEVKEIRVFDFFKLLDKVLEQLETGHLSFIMSSIPVADIDTINRQITEKMFQAIIKNTTEQGESAHGFVITRDVSPRQLMQWWGTEAVRQGAYEDVWVDAVQSEINASEARVFIVSDARFDNECLQIQNKNFADAVLCIKVLRGNKVQVSKHVSELGVSRDLVDYEVTNDSTMEDLESELHNILFDDTLSGELLWLDN